MKSTAMIAAGLLLLATAGHADHDYLEIGTGSAGPRWHGTQHDMGADEYAARIRANRQLLTRSLRGPALVPGSHDTLQLDLDVDGPLKLKLRDSTRSRRALMLEFRQAW